MSARGLLRIAEGDRLCFWCPGCEEVHRVVLGTWTFNGDFDKPTFSPSVLVTCGHYVTGFEKEACWCTYNREHPEDPAPFVCYQCHSFVVDGTIQFLGDCTHALAGQTVQLIPPSQWHE